jgi:hypothetical protein
MMYQTKRSLRRERNGLRQQVGLLEKQVGTLSNQLEDAGIDHSITRDDLQTLAVAYWEQTFRNRMGSHLQMFLLSLMGLSLSGFGAFMVWHSTPGFHAGFNGLLGLSTLFTLGAIVAGINGAQFLERLDREVHLPSGDTLEITEQHADRVAKNFLAQASA